MQPDIAVVIPMLNAERTLPVLVESLAAQDFAGLWEVIAVDNGSTDRTVHVARELLTRVPCTNLIRREVVVVPDPRGYATPRTAGARLAHAPLLAFCDADGAVDRGWLSAIAGRLGEHPLVASVKIRSNDVSARAEVRPEVPNQQLPRILGVRYAAGAGMGMRTEVFEALDGFDPFFDSGGEDTDFSFRARFGLDIEPVLSQDAVYWTTISLRMGTRFAKGYRDGRTTVRLFVRHFRNVGHESTGPATSLGRVRRIITRNPLDLRSPHVRAMLAHDAGYAVGQVVWSVRLGVRCF